MTNDDFSVLLNKREGIKVRGAEVGGASIYGQPFYRSGSTGTADSIDAVLTAGLVHAPTYALIKGRQFVDNDNEAWSEYHDSRAEKLTVHDEKGILGTKGAEYVLDIQNGGLFVWNPKRIRDAVQSKSLVNGALQLDQNEIDGVLDALKRNDATALNQIVHGNNMVYAGDFKGFLETSQAEDFTKSMTATYIVLRTAEEAMKVPSGYRPISQQRTNPDLIIASAGTKDLHAMLDKAEKPEKENGFGWTSFGSWHDGYKNKNSGRLVVLGGDDDGFDGDSYGLDGSGRSVGVAPEALSAFYDEMNKPEVLKK